MKLKILFMQRKESYEGQYAPEASVVVDEFCYEENPTWFEERCEEEKYNVGGQASAWKVVEIEVDGNKIRELLIGKPPILDGTINP